MSAAEHHLSMKPLLDYGIPRMILEAREALAQIIQPATMAWLPDVSEHFNLLES